jgi:hypothetical protein
VDTATTTAAAAEVSSAAQSSVVTQSPAAAQGDTPDAQSIDPEAVYAKITAQITMPEMIFLPNDVIEDYYGIAPADYSGAVFYVCLDSLLADEIVIVCANDEASADRVRERLENRLAYKADAAENYTPDQFAVIQKGVVRKDGTVVALLVSPEIDRLDKEYSAALG